MKANMLNLNIILKVLSRILFIISAAFLMCIGVSFYFSESAAPFAISLGISLFLGLLFYFITEKPGKNDSMQRKDAYLTVTISWLVISLVGSLPYILSSAIPSFINAFFESVSGFTTTGSSILSDIESLPRTILFWRSLTHWIGGIGIIVLVIVIMPMLHLESYQLFTLESSLQEKIQPKIKSVGIRLLIIYCVLTVAEIILLLLGKMNLYESVCHAFGTVATGGFSPKNNSIAGYSNYIQYVIMFFMLMAGTNFVIHYYILKREIQKVKENEELGFYMIIVVIFGLVVTSILFFKMNKSFEESFREAFFQVISIITCTGYSTTDYLEWPMAGWAIIFLIMFFGGSTGSTAGGIKIARHIILFKNLKKTFFQLHSPNAIIPVKLNNKLINDETNNSILTFISLYVLIFIIGSLLLVITGVDEKTASSSVATCMAGIGPGIGSVGPAGNFAHIPDVGKIILSFLMLVGRLEIYTIIILFTRGFWTR